MGIKRIRAENWVFVNDCVNMTRRIGELTLNPTRETIVHEPDYSNCKVLYCLVHVDHTRWICALTGRGSLGAVAGGAAALLQIGDVVEARRDKSVAIRHLHLRQRLRVHHIGFLHDAVAKQNERGE